MKTLVETNLNHLTHLPNNFQDMSFDDKVKLLGFDFNNLANNEAILDKLFLHGKYAKQPAENSTSDDLNKHQAALAEIDDDEKINIFAKLLHKNLISKDYYDTQISRYQSQPLTHWGKHSLFKQLPDDDKVEELPQSTSQKDFLKEEETTPTNTFTNSPSL